MERASEAESQSVPQSASRLKWKYSGRRAMSGEDRRGKGDARDGGGRGRYKGGGCGYW